MSALHKIVMSVLEGAGPMENRNATCEELVKVLSVHFSSIEEPTRFELDMDGSMEPHPDGTWVRWEDL